MTRATMINGILYNAEREVDIPLDDGYIRGDGVFEGMRAYQRRVRTLPAHMSRLARSAREVSLTCDTALIADEVREFCQHLTEPDCGIRLMLSRSGLRVLREEPLPQLPHGIVLAPQPHHISPLLANAKTLSYAANMQAHRQARAAGADEALMYRDADGVIYEGPTSSFIWIEGETVCAPPIASTGVLDSITRRLVDEVVGITERERTLAELGTCAQAGMLVSTYLESVAVASVIDCAHLDPNHPRLGEVRLALRGGD